MPDDKKKQAMSLLFGDAPQRPPSAGPKADEPVAETPVAKTLKRQVAKASERPKPHREAEYEPESRKVDATPVGERIAGETPDPYYQGASRYRRAGGEQVKHSVYLDPDVSQALKVAAAMGNDTRGTNVSAIVNEALRELGYGA